MTRPAEVRPGGGAKPYLLLQFLLLLYSVYALLCKFAASEKLFSVPFFLFYGGALLVMLAYAWLWQKVLRRLPLNVAYSSKAVVVVWGMAWGAAFFAEAVTLPRVIGAAMVMLGIVLVVRNER